MKTIYDIEHLDGVKVIVRADFNVSIRNGKIDDDYRIRATLPTLEYLKQKGAKTVIVSHLEPKDDGDGSLDIVAERLNKIFGKVTFIKDWKQASEIIEHSENGSTILLENVRHFDGEKKNDPVFAKELASLGDIYINEGFAVSHRKHASVDMITSYMPSYCGIQFKKEIDNLSLAFNPLHPFLFILGGAKFDTKLPLLNKFVNIADQIFIGGALVNDIFKARGYEVGKSVVSEKNIDLSDLIDNKKIFIPSDVQNEQKEIKKADEIMSSDKILDVGPISLNLIIQMVNTANFILWNGPLGQYEAGFTETTNILAKTIGQRTKRSQGKVLSIVGGGDTLTAISDLGIEDQFTFVSTGGGAMLEFLAEGTLPGIEALNREPNI